MARRKRTRTPGRKSRESLSEESDNVSKSGKDSDESRRSSVDREDPSFYIEKSRASGSEESQPTSISSDDNEASVDSLPSHQIHDMILGQLPFTNCIINRCETSPSAQPSTPQPEEPMEVDSTPPHSEITNTSCPTLKEAEPPPVPVKPSGNNDLAQTFEKTVQINEKPDTSKIEQTDEKKTEVISQADSLIDCTETVNIYPPSSSEPNVSECASRKSSLVLQQTSSESSPLPSSIRRKSRFAPIESKPSPVPSESELSQPASTPSELAPGNTQPLSPCDKPLEPPTSQTEQSPSPVFTAPLPLSKPGDSCVQESDQQAPRLGKPKPARRNSRTPSEGKKWNEASTERTEEEERKESGKRRRSSRIRASRNSDEYARIPSPPQMKPGEGRDDARSGGDGGLSSPAPPSSEKGPPGFDPNRPVKVKSRWRRTSELEMAGEPAPPPPPPLPPSQPPLAILSAPDDPEVEKGIKAFEIIPQNIFLTPRDNKKEKLRCECTLTKEEIARGELGCSDDCLNRLLMIECGPRCILGHLCSNKQFQNCQYTPCKVIKTEHKGLGLIPLVNVSPGTFIMEYVGEVLESKEFRRRAKEYAKEKNKHYYFMQLESSAVIDATAKGNISRFINHSCDPNAETQKWSVNGELRIGFFCKKPIAAGEEITFDYKLDRYGKEAMRCYCGAANCRGWIGDNPDNDNETESEKEKEKSSKKEKKEKKKKEEKRVYILSDRELEYEIEKLSSTGIKNQKQTLALSRLMVRAEDEAPRLQLLELVQAAELPCLRLFLDYHGLGLLWSYMAGGRSSSRLKIEVLNTLSVLPISNKTMLQDSKVLNVVKKWARVEEDEPKDKDAKEKTESGGDGETPDSSSNSPTEGSGGAESDDEAGRAIVAKAAELIESWAGLKHEFRIPKKERIEQMKEHEREANRGYHDPYHQQHNSPQSDWSLSSGKERSWSGSGPPNYRERKRGRESPTPVEQWRKCRTYEERGGLTVMAPGGGPLTKMERRQLFALQVEEEERQRRLEEDWKQQQLEAQAQVEAEAQAAGRFFPPAGFPPANPSPHSVPPYCWPDALSSNCWVEQEGGKVVYGNCPPGFPAPFMGPSPHSFAPNLPGGPPQILGAPPGGPCGPPCGPPIPGVPPPMVVGPPCVGPPQMPCGPPHPAGIPPCIGPGGLPPNCCPHPGPPFLDGPSYPPPPFQQLPFQPSPGPPFQAAVPPFLPSPIALPATVAVSLASNPPPPPPPPAHTFPIKLPPKWRSAKDKEGRIYYYHTKLRKSQWQIPTEDSVPQTSDTESDSDDSSEDDDDSSTDEEDDDKEAEGECETAGGGEEEEEEKVKKEGSETTVVPAPVPLSKSHLSSSPVPFSPLSVLKKRREGLVSINIISPRDGEDDYRCGIKKKQIRATKEKLAREKKRMLQRQAREAARERAGGLSHGAAKCVADSSESAKSSQPKRRIKDLFRLTMANFVVSVLNPYRKSSCIQGRITSNEDFKYLAKKLTHFVMLKELKHSGIQDLECNDSVKHKAKDFIRKYMAKFGDVYKRGHDEKEE